MFENGMRFFEFLPYHRVVNDSFNNSQVMHSTEE